MFEEQVVLIFFQIHLALNIQLLVSQRVCIADALLLIMGMRNVGAMRGFGSINQAVALHGCMMPFGCTGVGLWFIHGVSLHRRVIESNR